jgi:DNA-binding response OmpR family regulator
MEEQEDLGRIVLGQTPSGDGLRRLERRGLVRLHLQRAPELFAPVFERCVVSLLGLGRAESQPPANGLEVEFTGVAHQARVNGELITNLLAPEFEILRCLTAARPEACTRLALIETMRDAEQQERSRRVQGDPLRRLEEYVRQLRAKLGPAGHLIEPTGDGYKLGQ